MSDYISFAHARALLFLAMAEEFGVRREVAVASPELEVHSLNQL